MLDTDSAPQTPNGDRRKIRSAWISFVGRISAQLIGAAATVGLGVVVFGNRDAAPAPPVAAHVQTGVQTPSAHSVLVAKPVRTKEGTVLVLVPLDRYAEVTDELVADVSAAVFTDLSQSQTAPRPASSHDVVERAVRVTDPQGAMPRWRAANDH